MSDHCSICDTDVSNIIAHHMAEHGGWEIDAANSESQDLDDE